MNAIINYFADYRKSLFVRMAIYVGFIISTAAATFLMCVLFVMFYRFSKFIAITFIIFPFIVFVIHVFISIFVGTDEEAEENPCYISDEEAYEIADFERDEAVIPVFDNDEVALGIAFIIQHGLYLFVKLLFGLIFDRTDLSLFIYGDRFSQPLIKGSIIIAFRFDEHDSVHRQVPPILPIHPRAG